ncbi:prisilkin-39-like [Cylas formicarius]|uniref:prisilkin-39-like n=1 Tax=Cylas formicarius TaxID=197179 RepID=UPI002958CA6E|nr:prisilkin-39-like [Cylas formicarius]
MEFSIQFLALLLVCAILFVSAEDDVEQVSLTPKKAVKRGIYGGYGFGYGHGYYPHYSYSFAPIYRSHGYYGGYGHGHYPYYSLGYHGYGGHGYGHFY